jgi:hypothetical protein
MEQDDPSAVLLRLLKRKWNEPVQVAQIGGDQDDGRVRPPVCTTIDHRRGPLRHESRTERVDKMCPGARDMVSCITLTYFLFLPVSFRSNGIDFWFPSKKPTAGTRQDLRGKRRFARAPFVRFYGNLYCFFIRLQTIVGNGTPTAHFPFF